MFYKRSFFTATLAILLCYNTLALHPPGQLPAILRQAQFGYCIMDVARGEVLYAKDAQQLFAPASTNKLLTTASAISILGAQKRFKTEVGYSGEIEDGGLLRGDVYIKGEGDPSLGSKHLEGMDKDSLFKAAARALWERGVRQVQGAVIGLSGALDAAALNPHWMLTDLGNYYGASCSNLCVYDNTYQLTLFKDKRPPICTPAVPGLEIEQDFQVSSRKRIDSLHITGPLRSAHRQVKGLFPARLSRVYIRGDLPNPPLQVAYELQKAMQELGIQLQQPPQSQRDTEGTAFERVYTYLSPTVVELSEICNHVSHNLFAEQLLLQIGLSNHLPLAGQDLSQTAVRAMGRYWKSRGLSFEQTDVLDGSGLAPNNRLSPLFLCSLLAKMQRGPDAQAFWDTLPEVGKEGTVKTFLRKSSLVGRAWLKSGSLRRVVCYAGYVREGERIYAIAVMVNNHQSSYWNVRLALEQFLKQLFA